MTHEEHQAYVYKTSPAIREACRTAANEAAAKGRTPAERRLLYKRAHASTYRTLRSLVDEQWREQTRAACRRYQAKLKNNPQAIRRRSRTVAPPQPVPAVVPSLATAAWSGISRMAQKIKEALRCS